MTLIIHYLSRDACTEANGITDLVVYCEKENVPFTTFKDFSDILSVVKDVVSGKVSVKDAATGRV